MAQQPQITFSGMRNKAQAHYDHDNEHNPCDIHKRQYPLVYHDSDSIVPSPTIGKLDFTSVICGRRFVKDE